MYSHGSGSEGKLTQWNDRVGVLQGLWRSKYKISFFDFYTFFKTKCWDFGVWAKRFSSWKFLNIYRDQKFRTPLSQWKRICTATQWNCYRENGEIYTARRLDNSLIVTVQSQVKVIRLSKNMHALQTYIAGVDWGLF